jgi:hypothetical protein
MNKTHVVLLSTGIGGSLALTLMMGHLLAFNPDVKATGPVAKAFAARFRDVLEAPPSLSIKSFIENDDGGLADVDTLGAGDGGTTAGADKQPRAIVVTARVRPKSTTDVDRMCLEMGAFLWKAGFDEGQVRDVMVVWRDPVSGDLNRSRLPRPSTGPTLRLFGSGR